MAPPHYTDLGKNAREIFNSGFHFGLCKLDLKTKSDTGIELGSGLNYTQDSGKVFGHLQTKYAVKDYGLTFTERWNTDNILFTDITWADKLVQGLKLGLDASFAPATGNKDARFRTDFINDLLAFHSDLNFDLNGPLVNAALVLKHEGWLAGYQTQFDSQKSQVTKNNFALGFAADTFELHTNVNNGSEYGGSVYQKVNDKLHCGVSLNWTSGSSDTKFGLGAKYALDSNSWLRAKVNNASQIGLGYQHKLRDGVTLALSALIDGQNFNAGGHKVGLALDLDL